MGVDTARSGKASADYTVAIVIAYKPSTGEKRIVWFWRERGLKINIQIEKIAEISRKFNNPLILVETNNMGVEFVDQMIDNYGLNVEEFTTTKGNKFDDLIRMLIVSFEKEKIIFPQGDARSRKMMDIIDRELDRFVVEWCRMVQKKM